MITESVLIGMWKRLDDVYRSVTVPCTCIKGPHVIPLEVTRENLRFGIATGRDGLTKKSNGMAQIARVVIDTQMISKKFKTFMGADVAGPNGESVPGDWRKTTILMHFLATDWEDLFGKDIAWQMARETESFIFDYRNSVWDQYLFENGACLTRGDVKVMKDGMLLNQGIENIYQVTLAFSLTDERIWSSSLQSIGSDPVEQIGFEVEVL